MHRTRRIYEGTACADIRNGRQLISRGAGSSDRPRLFSIPIAPQDGANHDACHDELLRIITQSCNSA